MIDDDFDLTNFLMFGEIYHHIRKERNSGNCNRPNYSKPDLGETDEYNKKCKTIF